MMKFLMNLPVYFTLPTILTLFRLLFSPFLLTIFLVTFIPYPNMLVHGCLAFMFAALSFTDFLDGFLARRWGQESELGKVLDPIADKFLLFSTLIALVVVNRIYYYWVIILIGREFFIMGLRLLALENSFEIKVSQFGKAKTMVQCIYLIFVILNPLYLTGRTATFFMLGETTLLVLTLLFSIGSAYHYYLNFIGAVQGRIYEGDFK